jgi:hypothetical protein
MWLNINSYTNPATTTYSTEAGEGEIEIFGYTEASSHQ